MNLKKILSIITLPLMWLLYIIFEVLTGRINDMQTIYFNIFIMILFAITGLFIYILSLKFEHGISFNKLFLVFFILMLIDQGLKIIIKSFYFNNDFEIIPNLLSFNPIINTNGSWLNARFGTSVSFSFLIFMNVVALIIFFEIYRYYLYNKNKDFWSDMCFIFIFAGALCSLIDKVFYGGSLDFIGISTLFIADIKDLYINIGILFFILTIFTNGYLKSNEDSNDLTELKKFLSFIYNDLKGKHKLFKK